ncbi:MAG: DUF1080 domain-containing protein [Cyclobacteriaceae bacterium]|nr:DUF1080 domain-containing protein [Cyclobacteriaceae bacterium SS2]
MIDKTFFRISSLIVLTGLLSCSSGKKEGGEASTKADEYQLIFDGKTLNNWKGDPDYWKVEDGAIVGYTTEEKPLEANTFLIWDGGQPADFELVVDFRISQSGNSGIQYRSEMVEGVPFGLKGYQADIDGNNNYTGQNYEERKRATLAYRGQQVIVNSQEDPNAEVRDNVKKNAWQSTEIVSSLGDIDELKTKIKSEDWNECKLVIKGNLLQHYINGVLMSEVTDNDAVNRKSDGLLGFQIHRGPPMKVEFKNIRYKAL